MRVPAVSIAAKSPQRFDSISFIELPNGDVFGSVCLLNGHIGNSRAILFAIQMRGSLRRFRAKKKC